jgi:asparagine synthase (glutamine-hydrolysing)
VLARDPLGIKPLYVARVPGGLLFASEVRALLASGLVPRGLDPQGVAGFLAYGALQHPCTLYRAVRSFPPGCWQPLVGGPPARAETAPQPFWWPPRPRRGCTEAEAVPALRSTLEAAVRDHLVSDVPVGVFLSSGLDSTTVATLAARHSSDLRAFTVGFGDHPDLSELRLAGETARRIGLPHTAILVNGPDALRNTLAWLQALDQPSMDGLNTYLIAEAVRGQGIVVALSGQGGDELLGGYPSFADVPRLRALLKRIGWLPRPLGYALGRVFTAFRSEARRHKLRDMARTGGGLLPLYLQRRRVLSNQQMAALGIPARAYGLTEDFLPPEALAPVELDEDDPVWTISQLECRFYLGNMLLRDGDTNGMAHGLEIRVPLLDQRVLDLVSAIPGRVRLPKGRADKHLLRRAFGDCFPAALTAQRKRGFTLPLAHWMTGPLRDWCEQALTGLKAAGLLNPAGVDGIWATFLREPRTPIWTRALTLCVLGSVLQRPAHGPGGARPRAPPAGPAALGMQTVTQ